MNGCAPVFKTGSGTTTLRVCPTYKNNSGSASLKNLLTFDKFVKCSAPSDKKCMRKSQSEFQCVASCEGGADQCTDSIFVGQTMMALQKPELYALICPVSAQIGVNELSKFATGITKDVCLSKYCKFEFQVNDKKESSVNFGCEQTCENKYNMTSSKFEQTICFNQELSKKM